MLIRINISANNFITASVQALNHPTSGKNLLNNKRCKERKEQEKIKKKYT